MVVNNPLSRPRGLDNITKVYLITCGQSACSKLKKHEFSRYFSVEMLIFITINLKAMKLRITQHGVSCNRQRLTPDNYTIVRQIITGIVQIKKSKFRALHQVNSNTKQ